MSRNHQLTAWCIRPTLPRIAFGYGRSCIGTGTTALLVAMVVGAGLSCERHPREEANSATQAHAHSAVVEAALREDEVDRRLEGSAWEQLISLGNDAVPDLESAIKMNTHRMRAALALAEIGTSEAFNSLVRAGPAVRNEERHTYMRMLARALELNPAWSRTLLSEPNVEWLDNYVNTRGAARPDVALRIIEQLGPEHYRRCLDSLARSDNAQVRLKAMQLVENRRRTEAADKGARSPAELLRLTHEGLQAYGSGYSSACVAVNAPGAVVIVLSQPGHQESPVRVIDARDGRLCAEWTVCGSLGPITSPAPNILMAQVYDLANDKSSVFAWNTHGEVSWSSTKVEGQVCDVASMMVKGQVQQVVLGLCDENALVVLGPDGVTLNTSRKKLLLNIVADSCNKRYLLETHVNLQWWTVGDHGGAELSLPDLPLKCLQVGVLARPVTRVIVGGEAKEGTGGVAAYDDQFRSLWYRPLPYRVESLAVVEAPADLPAICALTVNGDLVGFDPEGHVVMQIDTDWINALARPARRLSCAAINNVLYLLIHDGKEQHSRVYAYGNP